VTTAWIGNEGRQLAQKEAFDMITLDVDLPEINGFEICCRLKRNSACAAPW